MVKVAPTFSSNGLHEAKNNLSLRSKWEDLRKNGRLEKFREETVTLDPNSMARLKIKNVTLPMERAANTIHLSLAEVDEFRRIARNKDKTMTISAPVIHAGSRILHTSIAR